MREERAHPFAGDALFFLAHGNDRDALAQLGDRAAAALADPSATDHEREQTLLALTKLRDADRTVATLTSYLDREAVTSDVKRAQWVLQRFGSALSSALVPTTHRGLIDAVVPLLETPALRGLAKSLLAKMDRVAVRAATTGDAKPSKGGAKKPAAAVASKSPAGDGRNARRPR